MTTNERHDETMLESSSSEEIKKFAKKWFDYFKDLLFDRGLKHAYTWVMELVVRLIRGAPIRRFSEITPQLFIGGQQRKRGWPLLKSWGVTAVVSLRSRFDDRKAGITTEPYLHLPTIDNTPPTLQQLHDGVQFIQEQIENDGAVYVHCEAGVGRSATQVAAYLIDKQGLSVEQAWDRIRSVRPFIRPTSSQKAQIKRFEAQIQKQPSRRRNHKTLKAG